MDLKPLAHLLGNPMDPQCLSDHVPLMAVIRQGIARPTVPRGWPRWLAETPEFLAAAAALAAAPAPPFSGIDVARKVLQDT